MSTPFGIRRFRDGSSPIVRRFASTVSETAVNRLLQAVLQGAAFDGGCQTVVPLRGHPLGELVVVRGVDRRDPVGNGDAPGKSGLCIQTAS